MRKLFLASVALLALTGGAHAADFATKARPFYTGVGKTTMSWTGFYGGINLGYGFGANGIDSGGQTDYANTSGDTDTETHGPGGPAWNSRSNLSGFVGGGQVGYNHQSGFMVYGLETDLQGANLTGSSTVTNTTAINLLPFPLRGDPNLWPLSGTETTTEKLNWYGTLRGRVGVSTMDNTLLVYGTGGLAYGSVQQTFAYTGGFLPDAALGFGGSHWAGVNSVTETKVGWTAGAGVEWRGWGDAWSVKAEYLYTDLGSTTVGLSAPAFRNSNGTGGRTVSATNSMDDVFQTVRIGLNYHFK